jgi:pimeloyl-ACP methyl ester carboxylesterase
LDAKTDHYGGDASAMAASTWKQRFFLDDSQWCGTGCPIFLHIGGESSVTAAYSTPLGNDTHMSVLAQQHSALQVVLEHRFFGESYPLADLSTANLQYLTTEQALADLAHFTEYLLSYDPAAADALSLPALALKARTRDSKVVTFGASYPGALSAWSQLKFPALFAGAVSSSGPVHAEAAFEVTCLQFWRFFYQSSTTTNSTRLTRSLGVLFRTRPSMVRTPASRFWRTR